jgi:hypothetical protein
MTLIRYKLEIGRWGEDWHEKAVDITNPADFANLTVYKHAAFAFINDFPQYEARIVDSSGTICAHFLPPIDVHPIDIKLAGHIWLDVLRESYGIPEETFAAALRAWLDMRG